MKDISQNVVLMFLAKSLFEFLRRIPYRHISAFSLKNRADMAKLYRTSGVAATVALGGVEDN